MKNILKIFTVVLFVTGLSLSSFSQKAVKIGYVDLQGLIAVMPGIDSVKAKLQVYQKSLSDQMDAMRAEFENKYLDYQQNSSTLSDLIKQTKEKELTDLQARIDGFQQKASQDLQAKQQELLQPIIEKAKNGIRDVARENGYTCVLNAIDDVVLFSEQGDDILPLVKKKLGIQ